MKLMDAALVLVLLGWNHVALAEGGCPPGQYPYNAPGVRACIPIPGSGSSTSSEPVAIWEDRWGAIAMDLSMDPTPAGVSESESSKRKAQKAALAECRARGGKLCKVRLSYRNQCAVIAWGGRGSLVQGAESVEVASELALKSCRADGDADCRIWYSGCSYPARVQ